MICDVTVGGQVGVKEPHEELSRQKCLEWAAPRAGKTMQD
jgi:hypothetical protein